MSEAGDEKSGASANSRVRPVVALGASAGGLEAFREFLNHVPADTGMSFVIVQHLDPRQPSIMPELLASFTGMRVRHPDDGDELLPDHVYVMPPNASLGVERGRLRVRPLQSGAQRTAINTFFRELAEDQSDNAVAIVLSGIGSDGALGLKAIKVHGGLTLAQTPDEARYDAMPRNAITSGLVDHVLPVHQMPERLVNYAAHVERLRGIEALDAEIEAQLPELLAFLKEQTGHDFSQYKQRTLMRRIARRLQVEQVTSLGAYLERLRADPDGARHLVRDLLVGVTQFLRDPDAFYALWQLVLEPLARKNASELRIWVPGCSTGEEPYTIAMLVSEAFEAAGQPARAQIFATDLDERALEAARYGRFSAEIAEDVGPARLDRYFERDGQSFVIDGRLRDMCIFSHHDLVRDPPFSRLDLVSCRNLLIYLEPELQARVLELFHYALGEGGHLFLGPSENVTGRLDLFRAVDKRHRIFARKPSLLHRAPGFRATDLGRVLRRNSEAARRTPPLEHGLGRSLESVLLAEFAPAAMVVNEQGDVVYVSGPIGKFIDPQAGVLTLNATNLVLRQLRPDLRAALHESVRSQAAVSHEGLQIELATGVQLVALGVRPLTELDEAGLYVVVFQELGPPEPPSARPPVDSDRVVHQLESELKTTKEHLQSTIEELETSNEELKSSNEELLSMNEELQSLNEEFETLNVELKHKVEELDALNSDLDNLLRSAQMPMLFLDSELRIRRFTPATADVFHIIDSDVGRPITDLAPRFDASSLPEDAQRVLRTLATKEREVELSDARAYIMRTTPYRTLDNLIDGVVVTFVDLTLIKQAELQQARLAAIVEGASEAILAKTLDGTITAWNRAAEAMYGYTAEEAIGKHVGILAPPDRQRELEHVFELLGRGEVVPRFETARVRKDGTRLDVALAVSPILSRGKLVGASAIATDITAEKAALRALRISEERYRSLVAATSTVVWTADASGAFTGPQPTWERFSGQTAEEHRGWGFLDAIHPDDRAEVQTGWRRALAERSPWQQACRVYSVARRAYAHSVLRAVPVFEESGAAREWVGTLADVTVEHEAHEALRARADELKALFENSTAGIVEADANGRIVRVNRRFCELFGYEPEELGGKAFVELAHPDDRDANMDFFQSAATSRSAGYSAERRMLTKQGGEFFVQLSAGILRLEDGTPSRVIGVLQDISERKRAEVELERAKAQAEQANRAKDQFLAVLSHELRTPLTPVLGAAAKLERTENLSPAGKATLRMIQRNAELEARLIDDLLDLTRISRGRLQLRTEVIDAALVMQQALDIVSVELDAKNLRVDSALQPGCYVRADAARLQQVYWNLLKNSIKFTPAGGSVRVRCRPDAEERIVTEVSDTGVGIPRQLLPHVFDAFEQGTHHRREGLGLGLSICRALVELHGGQIFAESGGPDCGSTFRVLLPATSEKPAASAPRRADTPPETRSSGLAVLLVEDHADSAQLMRELLELSGHEVEQASTLREAVSLAETRQFDLLLSDLGLPDGSGLELVRVLREAGRVRYAIALSGYGMEDDLRRSREAGFEEHLVKPVDPRELDATIRRVTRSRSN